MKDLMMVNRILAAQEAEATYLGECNWRRAERSQELCGHRGASIPSEAPNNDERVRLMIEAADRAAKT